MIGKGSEAIQRQQQWQQSTKRWRGMEAWIDRHGAPWSMAMAPATAIDHGRPQFKEQQRKMRQQYNGVALIDN
jgi:hypothetical protein